MAELTQNIPELNQLWNEIQDSLLKIDDNILINHFEQAKKEEKVCQMMLMNC